MFGLVDGTNFYVSCERTFNPKLNGIPVGILSNNDGCVIARSQELKDLNIPMGAPAFKWKRVFAKHNVQFFSANFPVYGEMSRRMMEILKQLSPAVEIYSIDEAFVDFNKMPIKLMKKLAYEINDTIPKWIGIPVGIGVAPTKTLAKIANKISKKNKKPILLLNQNTIDQALKITDIHEVWGIGGKLTERLKRNGINTAYDFANTDIWFVRDNFSVVQEKTYRELKGISCIGIEEIKPKKEICTSRSFGKRICEFNQILSSVRHFVGVSAEKLRRQNSYTGAIEVYMTTDPFADGKKYSQKTMMKFNHTSSTAIMLKYAEYILKVIWREGLEYKKAGVVLRDIISIGDYQPTFMPEEEYLENPLDAIMDKLNMRFGRRAITLGTTKPDSEAWWMNQRCLSANYFSFKELMSIST